MESKKKNTIKQSTISVPEAMAVREAQSKFAIEALRKKHEEHKRVLAEKREELNKAMAVIKKPEIPKKYVQPRKDYLKQPFEFTLEELSNLADGRLKKIKLTILEYLKNKDGQHYTPVKKNKDRLNALDVKDGKVKLFFSHGRKLNYAPFPCTFLSEDVVATKAIAVSLYRDGGATYREFDIEDVSVDVLGNLIFTPSNFEKWYKEMIQEAIDNKVPVPEKVIKALGASPQKEASPKKKPVAKKQSQKTEEA